MENKPEDILLAREKRVEFQELLLKKFNIPLLVMKVNYPGVNKENEITTGMVEKLDIILSDIFQYQIVFKIYTITAEGPILIMCIDKEAFEIKNIAVDIENKHILGRCVDIDIYTVDGKAISRRQLGYKPRKCYLCEEEAHICARSRKHSEEEIIRYIRSKYIKYLQKYDEIKH